MTKQVLTSGMMAEGRRLLLICGRELDLDLEPFLPQFETLYELLTRANAQMNLTALREERDIVLKHFADSLTCLQSGQLEGDLRIMDVGTGAGFPGLPLAVVSPQLDVTLLDATRRKIEFVEQAIGELHLSNAHPLVGRAETVGRDPGRRETFDRVVTRAVSSLSVLAEVCLPLLRVGGFLIAQKGADVEAELAAGERAVREVGGELVAVQRLSLPITGDARHLVVVRKTRPTPDKYPRREGVPNMHPLC